MNNLEAFLSGHFFQHRLLERFKALKSNLDRINFAMEVLESMKISASNVPMSHNCKNDDLAIKYRKLGNEMFLKMEDLEALKMYTKSIAHAKTKNSLALAYGNRSAVLFRKKYYRECTEDILRALQCNYPKELKEKLLRRQEDATKLIPQQRLLNYHHTLPTIKNKNLHIPVASDLVEVKRDENYGRDMVVAAKDIKAGDILIIEKPYVIKVQSEYKYLNCCECLELCFNLIPCDNCTEALYCSQACKQEAFISHHKYECLLFRFGLNIEYGTVFNMVLKSSKDLKKGLLGRLQEILTLEFHREKVDDKLLLQMAFSSSLVYWLLKERTDFFVECYIDENILKELFYNICLVTHFKFVAIFEESKDINHLDELISNHIGNAFYIFLQKFRHSCDQNTIQIPYGSYMVMRSLHDIKKGEEIYCSDGLDYLCDDILTRRRKIYESYDMQKCLCRPCVERWPTFENLPPGPEIPANFMFRRRLYIREGNTTDEQLVNTLLPKAVELYDMLKISAPNRNLVIVALFIKIIYRLMGNVIIDF